MTTVIDAVLLRFWFVEGYKRQAPTTDANISESLHSTSSFALISYKCKRSVYRKNTLKYHRMR